MKLKINMKEKYQGWTNRSTWLVVLWLDNESPEIYKRVREIAIISNTKKHFINYIKPFLLDIKGLWKESNFDILQTNWSEVWEHLAPSTKY